MSELLLQAVAAGDLPRVQGLLASGADCEVRSADGATALMMVKKKFYVDVVNLLHEAERAAGVGEGSCTTKNTPGSQVVTFRKPAGSSPGD